MHHPKIFREYDIRGVVDKDFDEEFPYLLARAHTQFVKEKTGKSSIAVSIGHDARLTCPKLYAALEKGYIESGAKVYKLGLVTSPLSYYSTFKLDIDGAIMLTGSHNPPEYNGFKISVGKTTIFGDDIMALKDIIDNTRFPEGKGESIEHDLYTTYVDEYKEAFKSLSNVKVVFDCGNGAAGPILERLLGELNIQSKVLFSEPDGNFPNHHPDPTIEKNLVSLKEAIGDFGADFGIGFDGDADRIVVVDEKGNTLYGDELMVIISRHILKDHPGAKIIGDVKCSDRLYQDIDKNGGEPIMWKTGHSLIKKKIKEEKAPFGGEMSGHIFFNDKNYGYDDAIYAALRMAEIVQKSDSSISDMLSNLPQSHNTPEVRIDTTEELKIKAVDLLVNSYKKGGDYQANFIDGLRVSYPSGAWFLARSSNTQPVLVLRFEAPSEEELKTRINEVKTLLNGTIDVPL